MKKIYITFLLTLSLLPHFAANSLEEELEQNAAGDIDTHQVVRNHRREIIRLQSDLNPRKKPFWEKKSFYINLIGSTLGLVLIKKNIETKRIESKNIRLEDVKDIIGLIHKCKMQSQRSIEHEHGLTDGAGKKVTYEDY